MCVQKCYFFPSKHCFYCMPQILILCFNFIYSKSLLIYLDVYFWHVLFWNVLFYLHVIWDLTTSFLLPISNVHIIVWKQHCIISVLLSLLRWFWWHRTWPVLVDAPCELGRACVVPRWVRGSADTPCVQLTGNASTFESVLIFCLLGLPIADRGVLRFITVIVY